MHHAITGSVTKGPALRATAWREYLEGHACHCHDLLADAGLGAQILSGWITHGMLADGFTIRDVRCNHWKLLPADQATRITEPQHPRAMDFSPRPWGRGGGVTASPPHGRQPAFRAMKPDGSGKSKTRPLPWNRDIRACTFATRPLQALIALPRRQAILFRRRIPSEPDMGRLQQIDVDMVKQSGAALVRSKAGPHFLILPYDCCTSRSAPR